MVSAFVSHRHDSWHGGLNFYYNKGEGNGLHQPGVEGDTLGNFEMIGMRWKEQYLWKRE